MLFLLTLRRNERDKRHSCLRAANSALKALLSLAGLFATLSGRVLPKRTIQPFLVRSSALSSYQAE